jgi:hypothetical protein
MHLKLSPSVDYLEANSLYRLDQAQIIARQREIKESVAGAKDFSWMRLTLGPSLRFVEGFAAVLAVLYLLAGVALSGGLLFGAFNQ